MRYPISVAALFSLAVAAGVGATGPPAHAQTAAAGSVSAAAAGASSFSGGSIFNFGSSKTNTPDAVAPGLAASPGCINSTSIGVGAMGFGLSGGSTYPYQECNLQQWSTLIGKMCQVNAANANECWWWFRGVVCAGNPTVAAVAPPGVCKGAPAQEVAAADQSRMNASVYAAQYQGLPYAAVPTAPAAPPSGAVRMQYYYSNTYSADARYAGEGYLSGAYAERPSLCSAITGAAERRRYARVCGFAGFGDD